MANFKVNFAICLVIASLGLAIAALATTHWIDTLVDREMLMGISTENNTLVQELATNPVYFSRFRGLFKTCYDVEDSSTIVAVLDEAGAMDNCLQDEGITSFTSDMNSYDIRNHIVRAILGGLLVAILFLIVGLVLHVIGQCSGNVPKMKTAAIILVISAVLDAGAMIMFTVIRYYEQDSVGIDGMPVNWQSLPMYADLANATSVSFWYSFIVGWASVTCLVISSLLLCSDVTSSTVTKEDTNWNRKYSETNATRPTYDEKPSVTKMDEKRNRRKLNSSHPPTKKDSIYSWGYAGDKKDKISGDNSYYDNKLYNNSVYQDRTGSLPMGRR